MALIYSGDRDGKCQESRFDPPDPKTKKLKPKLWSYAISARMSPIMSKFNIGYFHFLIYNNFVEDITVNTYLGAGNG